MTSTKNRTVALLLCIFLGIYGAHRFYTKRPFTGILWLCTLGLLGVGALIDFILIITGTFRDGEHLTVKNW